MSDPKKHPRHSVRLPHYDYRAGGAYFITICAAQKRATFGRLENGAVRLHPYGKIVAEEWLRTAEIRPGIALDEYIVMPDHFHAIVWITEPPNVGAHGNAPNASQYPQRYDSREVRAHCHAPLRAPRSLSSLVAGFKGSVTRRINAHRAEQNLSSVVVWQRSFYERIIRDENELNETRRYIIENPTHTEHP